VENILGISDLNFDKCKGCKWLERAQTIRVIRYFCGLVVYYNEYLIFGLIDDAEDLRDKIPDNCYYKQEVINYLNKIKEREDD